MDYFLADRHFLRTINLPAISPKSWSIACAGAFQPYAAAPPVNGLPALATAHHIRHFNRSAKSLPRPSICGRNYCGPYGGKDAHAGT